MSEKFEGNLPPQEQDEKYSADFKSRVKEVFPDFTQLHEFLDSGSNNVGACLRDESNLSMKPGEIVDALEAGNQEKVLEAAKRAKTIGELYREWLELQKK